MPIADVQSVSGTTATLVLPPAVGSALDTVVVAQVLYQNAVPAAPTDSSGNSYRQIGTAQYQGDAGLSLWIAENISTFSGLTITARPNGTKTACVAWVLHNVRYNNDWVANKATGGVVTVGPTAPSANSFHVAFANVASAAVLGEQSLTGWNLVGANGFTAGMSAAAKVNTWASANDCWSMYVLAMSAQSPEWPGSPGSAAWVAMAASFEALPTTYAVQRVVSTGLTSPAASGPSGILVQPKLDVLIASHIVIEPNNVGGSSGGGTGGGETSVVF